LLQSAEIERDISKARKICEELLSGIENGFKELYEEYHNLFLQFAVNVLSRKLNRPYKYSKDNAEDIVSDFCQELLNGKTFEL